MMLPLSQYKKRTMRTFSARTRASTSSRFTWHLPVPNPLHRMDLRDVLDAFEAEARKPDRDLRLDRAALLIAAGEYPELDIDRQVARFDDLAAGMSSPIGASPRDHAHALYSYLFEDLGFHGN